MEQSQCEKVPLVCKETFPQLFTGAVPDDGGRDAAGPDGDDRPDGAAEAVQRPQGPASPPQAAGAVQRPQGPASPPQAAGAVQ